MSRITISELEVFMHVGVTDEERAKPQRLLITVDMEYDFSSAAMTDRLTKTIDYSAVAQHLLKYGEGRSWKLIEKLATDVADTVLSEFQPPSVTIEVKKFVIPQAKHVAVSLTRARGTGTIKKMAWGIP